MVKLCFSTQSAVLQSFMVVKLPLSSPHDISQCSTLTLAHLPGASRIIHWASVSCTGCPFGQVVKDNTWATGTRIKSYSCSNVTWSLFWNFSQVNIEGEWKTCTVTGPYADTLSISFSAMFFFTSKYSLNFIRLLQVVITPSVMSEWIGR